MPARLHSRLKKLEAQRYAHEGPQGQGLAALLAFARHGSQPIPAALDANALPGGLARLLQAAQEDQAREPRQKLFPYGFPSAETG